MAKIINKVGALSTLKTELEKRYITQFHSVKDIKEFERTYDQQLEDVEKDIRLKLKTKLESISAELDGLITLIQSKQAIVEEVINDRISELDERIKLLSTQKNNALQQFITSLRVSSLHRKIRKIEKGRANLIERRTKREIRQQYHLKEQFDELNNNFEAIVNRDAEKHIRRIRHAKTSIDELRPIILGSIGESMVSSKLSSLADNYVAINNVNIELSNPIYLPSENDRIFSFQIDHVVVGPGGVFAIETKHWGQESIASRDLFSPVKQVRRSGYALFRVINNATDNGFIRLDDSWGDRAISVRNMIVFTASFVQKKYKHVKLSDLASMNGYIQYFDEGLAIGDVNKIVSYLVNRCMN